VDADPQKLTALHEAPGMACRAVRTVRTTPDQAPVLCRAKSAAPKIAHMTSVIEIAIERPFVTDTEISYTNRAIVRLWR
jgi:hypothetical protein